jgi:hypothetical protein
VHDGLTEVLGAASTTACQSTLTMMAMPPTATAAATEAVTVVVGTVAEDMEVGAATVVDIDSPCSGPSASTMPWALTSSTVERTQLGLQLCPARHAVLGAISCGYLSSTRRVVPCVVMQAEPSRRSSWCRGDAGRGRLRRSAGQREMSPGRARAGWGTSPPSGSLHGPEASQQGADRQTITSANPRRVSPAFPGVQPHPWGIVLLMASAGVTP